MPDDCVDREVRYCPNCGYAIYEIESIILTMGNAETKCPDCGKTKIVDFSRDDVVRKEKLEKLQKEIEKYQDELNSIKEVI